MAELSIIILLLAHGGHWFGGREAWVELAWRVPDGSRGAVVEWSLGRDEWRLMEGETRVGGEGATRLTLRLPEVRAATDVVWRYTLREVGSGRVLETGERTVRIYPPVITADFLPASEGDLVVVGAADSQVARALDRAGVRYRRQDTAPQLAGARPMYVIVTPERSLSAVEQASLRALAEAGARLLVLGNRSHDDWFGFVLAPAPAPRAWSYRDAAFSRAAIAVLDGWLPEATGDVTAVRLTTKDADLADGTWPALGATTPPSRALAVMRLVGGGVILIAPLPLDDVANDPRAQVLLRSGLNGLRTVAPSDGVATEAEAEVSYAR